MGSKRASTVNKGIRLRTSSNEELSERRSSIRKSLESGLDLEEEDEEDEEAGEGPVKSKFMPFFKKFWPHLESQDNRYMDSSVGDELAVDEPTDSIKSINPAWYGRPVDEVDPFIFEDVSLIIYCLFCFLSSFLYVHKPQCG